MNKSSLKKLAMLGMAGGLLMSADAKAAEAQNANATLAAGCGSASQYRNGPVQQSCNSAPQSSCSAAPQQTYPVYQQSCNSAPQGQHSCASYPQQQPQPTPKQSGCAHSN